MTAGGLYYNTRIPLSKRLHLFVKGMAVAAHGQWPRPVWLRRSATRRREAELTPNAALATA
jgi:hypothetical protein